jgi:hemerythrin-like domain-containing protein
VAGPIAKLLEADHERLDALLARSTAGAIDIAAYEQFRAGLLRHIAIEEKVLFRDLRARGGEDVQRRLDQLHADHGALAALMVPTPTHELIETIRAVLVEHNPLEEGPDGLYAICDRDAGEDSDQVIARMHAIPAVRVSQHVDDERVHASIARLLDARRTLAARTGDR